MEKMDKVEVVIFKLWHFYFKVTLKIRYFLSAVIPNELISHDGRIMVLWMKPLSSATPTKMKTVNGSGDVPEDVETLSASHGAYFLWMEWSALNYGYVVLAHVVKIIIYSHTAQNLMCENLKLIDLLVTAILVRQHLIHIFPRFCERSLKYM